MSDEGEAAELIRRADLLGRGVSDTEIRSARRSVSIVAVRRGCFVDKWRFTDSTPEARHLLAARAALAAGGPGLTLSHESAALAWGMSLWQGPPPLVHLTVDRPTGGRVDAVRHLHTHPLADVDVVMRDGARVTSAARTVADLACALSFEAAVCVGDSALACTPTSIDDITEAIRGCGRRRGVAGARRAAAFLDGRSESVGESRSRVYLDRHGLPAPELQIEIVIDGRTYRPDFLWEDQRVLGEFDGLAKYTRNGESANAVVIREKLREDALRAAGWIVVRWTWADLVDGRLAQRIRAALSA
ncbi:hypothetical protein [Rhodococcus sp. SORGH_AS_0303]|uniref:hypothetical protein n=1 Tax=Rhodococcus sp. SORGH_AS_0303 TaxID=3041753 RepID=UPI002783F388|nr:hypothetical protein [Rhodococcus sp. SORGH_AS_0303]MDQ1199398.1 hypothetical protein [Rhodococcus sp. SORGH_AS_0303]